MGRQRHHRSLASQHTDSAVGALDEPALGVVDDTAKGLGLFQRHRHPVAATVGNKIEKTVCVPQVKKVVAIRSRVKHASQ